MHDKEIGEIRRRFKIDKTNINTIYGCFVNERREIISTFEQSLINATESEREMYLALLKKTLAGTLNKNLLNISFETAQVRESEEHGLLMKLKDSSLKDEESLSSLYAKIIENIMLEGNYLILVASEKYDVPYKAKDGNIFSEASDSTFNYFIACVCPVKESTAGLEYVPTENNFQNSGSTQRVYPPVLGFMFPSFNDRATDIYNVLYFTKNAADNHPELAQALFNRDLDMPAESEKEVFRSILREALETDCKLETLQTLQNKMEFTILEHKESKNPNALTIEKNSVLHMLEDCGVSDEKVEVFSQKYDEELGESNVINPKNIISQSQFEIKTPNVVIKVRPEFKELIETRVIEGKKYILIDAENSVEVNGVSIDIE